MLWFPHTWTCAYLRLALAMGINQSINQLMTYDMTIYDMTYGHLEGARDVYGWTGGESRSPNMDAAARNKESLCASLCPPRKAWMVMIHTLSDKKCLPLFKYAYRSIQVKRPSDSGFLKKQYLVVLHFVLHNLSFIVNPNPFLPIPHSVKSSMDQFHFPLI